MVIIFMAKWNDFGVGILLHDWAEHTVVTVTRMQFLVLQQITSYQVSN